MIRRTLQENGWAIAKATFDKTEAEAIRERFLRSYELGHTSGDLLSNPLLSSLVHDDRILGLAKEALGDRLVYFGDSNSLKGGPSVIPDVFHKDNVDRIDGLGPDWKYKPYTLIRIGFYLENHADYSGGVTFRTGSHTPACIQNGKVDTDYGVEAYAETVPGDLAIWYLSTSHCGNSAKIRHPSLRLLPTPMRYRFHKVLYLPQERERVGLFFTFGVGDRHMKRYINYLKHRTYAVKIWRESNYRASDLEALTAKGVSVLDMREEALNIDLARTFEESVVLKLPY